MRINIIVSLFLIFFTNFFLMSSVEDDFLISVETSIEPKAVIVGEESMLKIKIKASPLIQISASPEFVVRLNENESGVKFTKNFFTASELEFKTKQDGNNVFLELEKEVLIPFKVEEGTKVNLHRITGKIVFTAVEKKDNWSVKTFRNFSTVYFRSKIAKLKRNKRKVRKK